MGCLSAGAPQEEQVYPPQRMGTLAKNLHSSFCSIPQPMGCPIKASHPVNYRAHIKSQAGCSICARSEGGNPGLSEEACRLAGAAAQGTGCGLRS